MDKQILTALTAFITNEMREGRLTGDLFNKLDEATIQMIWNQFDGIAMTNNGNHSAIFKDIDKYCTNNLIDFNKDETIEIGLLEGYLKCLLLQIDNQTYSQDNNGQLRSGRTIFTFELIIEEIRNRSRYHKNASTARAMVEICGKLDEARKLRNNCKGHMTGKNGPLLKSYITAFFVSTIIYTKIQDLWAGFQIIVFENNASIQVKCGNELVCQPNNFHYGKPIYIPVTKKFFANANSIKITIQLEISFKGNHTKEITVKRGFFQSNPITMRLPKAPVPPPGKDLKPESKEEPLPAYGIIVQGNQIANIIKVGDPLETSGERVRTIPQLQPNQPINIWIYKHTQSGDMTPIANLTDSEKEPVLKKTISYSEAVNNETVTLKCTRDKSGKVKLEVTWGDGHDITELL